MSASQTPSENLQVRAKRLRYRATHRGMLEMDVVLGGYVTAHAAKLDADEITRLERLMDEQDADLLAWITGQQETPQDADGELIAKIAAYHRAMVGK